MEKAITKDPGIRIPLYEEHVALLNAEWQKSDAIGDTETGKKIASRLYRMESMTLEEKVTWNARRRVSELRHDLRMVETNLRALGKVNSTIEGLKFLHEATGNREFKDAIRLVHEVGHKLVEVVNAKLY